MKFAFPTLLLCLLLLASDSDAHCPKPIRPNILGDTTLAFDTDSILLDAGVTLMNYQWNTGATTRQIWVKSSGFYGYWGDLNDSTCYVDSTHVLFIRGISGEVLKTCEDTLVECHTLETAATAVWKNGDKGNTSIFAVGRVETYHYCTFTLGSFLRTDSIRIVPAKRVKADFEPDTSNLFCTGLPLKFLNKSEALQAYTQFWDWGDGTFSTLSNADTISHAFANPNIYVVRLTTIAEGCSTSVEKITNVADAAPIWFTVSSGSDSATKFFTANIYTLASYMWSCDHCEVLSGQFTPSAKIRINQNGSNEIRLQTKDQRGCPSYHSESVDILYIGLEEKLNHFPTSIYPNPASKSITIQVNTDPDQTAQLEFFNLTGKKLSEHLLTPEDYENGWSVNLDLQPGIYLVALTIGETRSFQKLVIE